MIKIERSSSQKVDYYCTKVNGRIVVLCQWKGIDGKPIATTTMYYRKKPKFIRGDILNKNSIIDSAIAIGCPLEKEKLTKLVNQASGDSLSEGGVSVYINSANNMTINW